MVFSIYPLSSPNPVSAAEIRPELPEGKTTYMWGKLPTKIDANGVRIADRNADYEYLTSDNPNQYPNNAISADNYYYEFKGLHTANTITLDQKEDSVIWVNAGGFTDENERVKGDTFKLTGTFSEAISRIYAVANGHETYFFYDWTRPSNKWSLDFGLSGMFADIKEGVLDDIYIIAQGPYSIVRHKVPFKINIDRVRPDTPKIYASDPRPIVNKPVTFTVVPGKDNFSGIDRTEYRISLNNVKGSWLPYIGPVVVDKEAKIEFEARSIDVAGNISFRSLERSEIDVTPPTRPTIKPSNTSWTRDNVSFEIMPGEDKNMGWSDYQIDSGPWTYYSDRFDPIVVIEKEGITTVRARSVDRVDQIGQIHEIKVYIDKSAPTAPKLTSSQSGWTNQETIVSLEHGTDTLSGVEKSEISIDGQPWQEYTNELKINKEGVTRVAARTIDKVGNISSESELSVTVDKTAPSAPKLKSSQSGWTNQDTVVTLEHGTDTLSGVEKSEFSIDGQPWKEYTGELKIDKEGITRIAARTIDKAGNISSESELSVSIDRTAPSAPKLKPSTLDWTDQDVTVILEHGVDTQSGVQKSELSIDGQTWKEYTSELKIIKEGITRVIARTIDKQGNMSSESEVSVYIDRTAPSAPKLNSSANGWSNKDVTVSLEHGIDMLSGVEKSEVSIDGQAWQEYISPFDITKEGHSKIAARTIDKLGHVSKETEITVSIDRSGPSAPKLKPSMASWTKQDVTVTLEHGVDSLSGVEKSEVSIDGQTWQVYTSDLLIKKEGISHVAARSIDKLGNIGKESQVDVFIDRTPPTDPKLFLSARGWTKQDVTVTLEHGKDAESGVQKSEVSIDGQPWQEYTDSFDITKEGTTRIRARTIDKVGNISPEVEETISIDRSAPSAPKLISNNNGWTNKDVTITLTHGFDNLSGVEKSEVSIDGQPWQEYTTDLLIKKEGISHIVARTIDKQGNISQVSELTVTIDRTAPSAPKLNSNHNGWTNKDVTITLTHGEDTLSGVLKSEISTDGQVWKEYASAAVISKEGISKVFGRTIDKVGNIGSEAVVDVHIDRTSPNIQNTPFRREWGTTDIPVTIRYSDDLSGVDPNSRKYAITQSPTPPANWRTATSDIQNVTISDEGEWYVHAAVTDNAGNVKQLTSQGLKLQKSPATPSNVNVVSIKENEVQFTWDLPSGQISNDGYEYIIERLNDGHTWTLPYPKNTFIDSGLSSGEEYTYRIYAKNHVGTAESEVTILTLPSGVKGLTVTPIDREANRAQLYFELTRSADKYHIVVKDNHTQQPIQEFSVTDAVYHELNQLHGGSLYSISVTPENASGRGVTESIGFLSLPDSPEGFRSVQIKDDEIRLGWRSVTSATYSVLERNQVVIYDGSGTDYVDQGLDPGTEYDYAVSAKNETGYGARSELKNLITLPGQVTVTGATYGENSITIQWQSIKGAESYQIGVVGSNVATVSSATYGKIMEYTIDGLNPGMKYEFQVYAVNRSGSGKPVSHSFMTLPESIPAGRFRVVDVGETTARLSWEEVAGADKYRIRVGNQTFEVSGTELKLTGLQGGQMYQATVEAGNLSGYGQAVSMGFLTLPPQVNGIKGIEHNGELQLNWNPTPSADYYLIEKDGREIDRVSTALWRTQDLIAGDVYRVSVRAVNATGKGDATPYEWRALPEDMGSFQVKVDVTAHEAILNWTDVTGADSYRLYKEGKQLLEVKGTTATLEHLESSQVYEGLKVVPVNTSGEGSGVAVPKFETLPSGEFSVAVKANQHELNYVFSIESPREMFVLSKDGKVIYRGSERSFILSSLPSNTDVEVEIWTENSSGQRSKGKIIQARTTADTTSSGSGSTGGGSTGSNKTEPPVMNEKKEEKEIQENNNEQVFIDIDGLYNKDQVLSLYEKGIVKASPVRLFEPQRYLTRAEFMAMIVRALKLDFKESESMSYKDIDPKAWYYDELQIAHANGVVHGYSTVEFRPNEQISREQAAKMLGNLLSKQEKGDVIFRDKSEISFWALKEVENLSAANVIEGYPDKTFRPKGKINRAESVSMIFKFIQ